MKPRLVVRQALDYTPEDVAIWFRVCPGLRHLLTWSAYSDRRDADLMHAWMHVAKDYLCARTCPTCRTVITE